MTMFPQQSARDPQRTPQSVFWWATVTDNDPLHIRRDGEGATLPVVPDSLVDPTTLIIGDRVWVQVYGHRPIVLGKGWPTS